MKLSIITVTLNNVDGLTKTLESVRSQSFQDFEQIVIDGGSTDGSVELIRARTDTISCWISERDSGPYDAMNKGARVAHGEWLLFLNSGDTLATPGALEEMLPFLADEDVGICTGGYLAVWPEGRTSRRKQPVGDLDHRHFYRKTVNHQSTFIRRAVFERFGPYDTSYRIIADREFFARATLAGIRCRSAPVLIAKYDMTGISAQAKISGALQKEQRRLHRLYPLLYRLYRTAADPAHFTLNRLYKRIFPEHTMRAQGLRGMLGKATGIGPLSRRIRERLMYGPSPAIPNRQHRIALVTVWFGEWPFWMLAFLVSCAKNPTIDWLIISNAPPPANLPANVKILPMTMEAFNARATQALGIKVNVLVDYAYKLCDLKIAYGRIFEQELCGYDFWGCCDMDIVWGNIRHFMVSTLLARYDIVTSRPNRIAGHFCLFRNIPEITNFFRSIPNIEQHILANRESRQTDEHDLTEILTRATKSALNTFRIRVTQGKKTPRVYWEQMLAPNGRHQLRLLEDETLSMRWQNGRVYDADGAEMMYLHFHKIRKTMNTLDFDNMENPESFVITAKGFLTPRESIAADASGSRAGSTE